MPEIHHSPHTNTDSPATRPLVQAVVIADENNAIGRDNKLLAHMPSDLKHFKALTIGFPVIMGRKTFDSIEKALPGRRNIVVSRQDLHLEGCEVVHSISEAIERCTGSEKVSIVGGATIYEQALAFTDVIELTRIHESFEADAWFPPIDSHLWEETGRRDFPADEKNPFPFSFITFHRRWNVGR